MWQCGIFSAYKRRNEDERSTVMQKHDKQTKTKVRREQGEEEKQEMLESEYIKTKTFVSICEIWQRQHRIDINTM